MQLHSGRPTRLQMVTTKQEIDDIIAVLLDNHRESQLGIDIGGNKLIKTCLTCEEMWPCSVFKLVDAFRNTQAQLSDVPELLTAFAFHETDLSEVVWSAWKEKMTEQGRAIKPHQHQYDTLPEDDKTLDNYIGLVVLRAAIAWMRNRYGYWQ